MTEFPKLTKDQLLSFFLSFLASTVRGRELHQRFAIIQRNFTVVIDFCSSAAMSDFEAEVTARERVCARRYSSLENRHIICIIWMCWACCEWKAFNSWRAYAAVEQKEAPTSSALGGSWHATVDIQTRARYLQKLEAGRNHNEQAFPYATIAHEEKSANQLR